MIHLDTIINNENSYSDNAIFNKIVNKRRNNERMPNDEFHVTFFSEPELIFKQFIKKYNSFQNITFRSDEHDITINKIIDSKYEYGSYNLVFPISVTTTNPKYLHLTETNLVIKLFNTDSIPIYPSTEMNKLSKFKNKYTRDKQLLPTIVPDIYMFGNIHSTAGTYSYLIMKYYNCCTDICKLDINHRIKLAESVVALYTELKNKGFYIRDFKLQNIGYIYSLTDLKYNVYLIDYEYDTLIDGSMSDWFEYISDEFEEELIKPIDLNIVRWSVYNMGIWLTGFWCPPYYIYSEYRNKLQNISNIETLINIDRPSFSILLTELLMNNKYSIVLQYKKMIYNKLNFDVNNMEHNYTTKWFEKYKTLAEIELDIIGNTHNIHPDNYDTYYSICDLIYDGLTPYSTSNQYSNLIYNYNPEEESKTDLK